MDTPFSVGEHLFSLPSLPATCRGVKVTVSRNALPKGDLARVIIEARLSPDDPWYVLASSTLPGGELQAKGKTVARESMLEVGWPERADGNGGRIVMRGSDARVILRVLQPFVAAITVKAT